MSKKIKVLAIFTAFVLFITQMIVFTIVTVSAESIIDAINSSGNINNIIRPIGRAFEDTVIIEKGNGNNITKNALMTNWSMSGFEIKFTGTIIEGRFFVNNYLALGVIIDGKDNDYKVIEIIKGHDYWDEKYIELASIPNGGTHTVKVIKLHDQSSGSKTGLISLKPTEVL